MPKGTWRYQNIQWPGVPGNSPVPGRNFSGTKFFRYRYRYFFPGPIFSGTGTIQKGAKKGLLSSPHCQWHRRLQDCSDNLIQIYCIYCRRVQSGLRSVGIYGFLWRSFFCHRTPNLKHFNNIFKKQFPPGWTFAPAPCNRPAPVVRVLVRATRVLTQLWWVWVSTVDIFLSIIFRILWPCPLLCANHPQSIFPKYYHYTRSIRPSCLHKDFYNFREVTFCFLLIALYNLLGSIWLKIAVGFNTYTYIHIHIYNTYTYM